MTANEAKEILVAYRRGSGDEADPQVAEALRLAANDAALRSWLEAQAKFQGAARGHMRGIQAPPHLRGSILRALVAEEVEKVVTPRSRMGPWLAWAAALALIIGGTFLFLRPRPDASFAAFRSRMVNFALRTYEMDIVTNNPVAVRQFIAAHGGASDFKMPVNLEKIPVQGGGRLTWQNHPVSMICYTLPAKETLFVFVIDRNAAPAQAPSAEAQFKSEKRLNTVSFSRDGYSYLLAANAPADTLLTLASGSPPQP